MTECPRRRLRAGGPLLLAALLWGGLAPARAQDQPAPDLAGIEATYEELFAAALALSDAQPPAEPLQVLIAWSAALEAAVVLEHARAYVATGGDPPPVGRAASERVLDRWRRLRPQSSGPDLMRAVEIQDAERKREAVVALLDRYPDDLLVIWQAAGQLRQGGESGRATELLEGWLAGHPDSPLAYRLLADHFRSLDNGTRQAEVLERWAQVAPEDPELVDRWMASSLPRQEPEATARLLADFFATRPGGDSALSACRQVAGSADPAQAEAGRSCLARLAADPDPASPVAGQATAALVEMAAAEGDWSTLSAALATLEPRTRLSVTIAAANRLETPARCGELLELLGAVRGALPGDGGLHRPVASSLLGCRARPAAEALYLDLLESVPASKVGEVIHAWVFRVGGEPGGELRGELPAAAAAVLERRLRDQPGEAALYAALDVVYELDGPAERRLDLLRRWQERLPETLDGERVMTLAGWMAAEGDSAGAIRALERQLDHRFEAPVAEMLWELYLEQGGGEQAARFAADLIAGGERFQRAVGHLLAARSAALAEDLDAAERHYREALDDRPADLEVAAEMLAVVGVRDGQGRLPELARRLCEEKALGEGRGGAAECTAELLARAGSGEAAAELLAERAASLPEDVRSLRELASTAGSAGQPEIAGRALRRIVEIDPRSEDGWVHLGVFLAEQGEVEALEELLARARRELPAPPVDLLRAAGRARVEAGRPEGAIEVLEEARGALPAGSEPGWIDAELRAAYEALGRQLPPAAGRGGTAAGNAVQPAAPAATGGSAAERLAAAEALQSGSGGRYSPAEALGLFEQAAAAGDPQAIFRLALLRRISGRGTPEGPAEAEALHRRSAAAVEELAAAGSSYARYLVGTAALVGLGGPEDPAAARRLLEAAARQGESWAWHNLAWMDETGRGRRAPDPAAALDGYRRASALGNVVSMLDVARLTLTPYAEGPPCDEGLRLLGRAAGAGHPDAAAFLGKVLFYGRGACVVPEPARALEWLEAGVEAGDSGAEYDLGLALLSGEAGRRDIGRGVALLGRVAGLPDPLAVETLAFAYATGLGVERDPAEARRLLAEAARIGSDGFPRLADGAMESPTVRGLFHRGAERLEALAAGGDPAAAGLLAKLVYSGNGLPADAERAVRLARPAAAAGDLEAMRVVAHASQHGIGTRRDTGEALRWWRRCAEAGSSFCMMFYSQALMKGELVEPDLVTGLAWLRRAAEAGNWWAAGDLGHLYDEGWYGLPRDPEEAAAWKRIRADLGDAEARGWLAAHGHPVD